MAFFMQTRSMLRFRGSNKPKYWPFHLRNHSEQSKYSQSLPHFHEQKKNTSLSHPKKADSAAHPCAYFMRKRFAFLADLAWLRLQNRRCRHCRQSVCLAQVFAAGTTRERKQSAARPAVRRNASRICRRPFGAEPCWRKGFVSIYACNRARHESGWPFRPANVCSSGSKIPKHVTKPLQQKHFTYFGRIQLGLRQCWPVHKTARQVIQEQFWQISIEQNAQRNSKLHHSN